MTIASAIDTDQKAHRHVVYSAMNPPAMGPKEGPSNVPSEYMLMDRPRSSGRHISDNIPPPIASGALPPTPDKKRKTMSCSFVFAKPHAKLEIIKTRLNDWMTRTRPYISDSGAMMSGPIAYARTKIESTRLVWSEEVIWSSFAIRPSAGATMVEGIDVINATLDMSVVIYKRC